MATFKKVYKDFFIKKIVSFTQIRVIQDTNLRLSQTTLMVPPELEHKQALKRKVADILRTEKPPIFMFVTLNVALAKQLSETQEELRPFRGNFNTLCNVFPLNVKRCVLGLDYGSERGQISIGNWRIVDLDDVDKKIPDSWDLDQVQARIIRYKIVCSFVNISSKCFILSSTSSVLFFDSPNLKKKLNMRTPASVLPL